MNQNALYMPIAAVTLISEIKTTVKCFK